MPRDIFCFILGDHSTFPVNFDGTELVDDLKKIKIETEPSLDATDAHALTLYQVALDESCAYDKKTRMSELERLFHHLNECTELDEQQELSVYFNGGHPPGKEYYILVQIPKSESIYCGGVVLMAGGFQMQPRCRSSSVDSANSF